MNTFKKYIENKNEKVCIIQRGIPGTGKSFTARQTLQKYGIQDPEGHIFSTDDYWTKEVQEEKKKLQQSGESVDEPFYKELEKDTYRKRWNLQELWKAHQWNFARFKKAVDNGTTPIVIDNTNIKTSDAKGYAQYAHAAGYRIEIQEPNSPWWKDHAHMMADKQKYGTELEDFARFLGGHHQGMSKKYGTQGNEHGVPLEVLRNMIKRWQPYTAEDLLGH